MPDLPRIRKILDEAACELGRTHNNRQVAWLRTRIDAAAPQVFVVPSRGLKAVEDDWDKGTGRMGRSRTRRRRGYPALRPEGGRRAGRARPGPAGGR